MLLQCHLQRSYGIGVHRSGSTGVVTQELLHRSSYIGVNSQVIYLYLNSYKTPTSQVSLFFSCGAGRLRLAKRDSLRRMCVSDAQTRGEMRILFVLEQPLWRSRVGRPNVWRNANFVVRGVALWHEMRADRQKLV